MRNKRFIAEHRGGLLSKENHIQLIKWAMVCSTHVLTLLDVEDQRLNNAIRIAVEWENGNVLTGAAMKASLDAHAVAKESGDPVVIAVARSIGQAVATAHMADHSLGAALYALKAAHHAGISIEKERAWQIKQLQNFSAEVIEIVLEAMPEKEKGFKFNAKTGK